MTTFTLPKNFGQITLTILGVFLLFAVLFSHRGTESYTAKTAQAQENYNMLMRQLCENGLKPLAAAKIDDKRAGFLDADVDLNDLARKEAMDCASASVQWDF